MEHKVRTWQHQLLSVLDEFTWFGYVRALDTGHCRQGGLRHERPVGRAGFRVPVRCLRPHTAIWGNCKTKVFFAPDNDLTAKRISQNLLGESTVEQPVIHQGGSGMQTNASTTYQFHGRPLLTPDELMDLPPDQEIIRVSGCKPILAQKVDYRSDVNLRRRVL